MERTVSDVDKLVRLKDEMNRPSIAFGGRVDGLIRVMVESVPGSLAVLLNLKPEMHNALSPNTRIYGVVPGGPKALR